VKIAAVGDLHCRADTQKTIRDLLKPIPDQAEVLLLAGDLTDNGRVEEGHLLVDVLEGFPIPIMAVLGNHDHESSMAEDLVRIFNQAGIHILEGTAHQIGEVGFVGAKGFCGGFDQTLIQPFGEVALKTFIQTSIDEAIQLENALAKLESHRRVALLHYAPVRDTLYGEPLELFPFLGSSRLANALDRQTVDVILHGHAHHGYPSGYTAGKIPVHNVSRFVQDKYTKQQFCLIDV
jgi:uncharacterized protein